MATSIPLLQLPSQTQTPSNSSSQHSLVSSLNSQSQPLLNSPPAPAQHIAAAQSQPAALPQATAQSQSAAQPQAAARPQSAVQSQAAAQPQAAAPPQRAVQSPPLTPQQPQHIRVFKKLWNGILLRPQPTVQSQGDAQPQPLTPQQPRYIRLFQKLWNGILLRPQRHLTENPKVIVNATRGARYVHAAPIVVSIFLLFLNSIRLYVGFVDAAKIQIFQIVAKMHEILILYSLGVVVFDVVVSSFFSVATESH